MKKSEAAEWLEKETHQRLSQYFTPAICGEMQHLLRVGKRIYIYIMGLTVALEQVSPLEIRVVARIDDVAEAEKILKAINNKGHFFHAIGNNKLQKRF